tara:strand:- start:736 stop:1083 length:348 start_codon:yes stop_codon:yes gene_type:complete
MANPRKRAMRKGRFVVVGDNTTETQEVVQENNPEPALQQIEEPSVEPTTEEGLFFWEPETEVEAQEEPEDLTTNDLVSLKKSELVEIAIEKCEFSKAKANKMTKNKLIDAILDSI